MLRWVKLLAKIYGVVALNLVGATEASTSFGLMLSANARVLQLV